MKLENRNIKIYICIFVLLVIFVFILIFVCNNKKYFFEESFVGNFEYENIVESNERIDEELQDSNLVELKGEEMCIHIVGEVINQGIVILNEGDRIIDAIEQAGGITENADISKINLAFELSDGQKVYVPNKNDIQNVEYVTNESGENIILENGKGSVREEKKININTATQTQLELLTGIGPSTAAKIIQYREKNGKFRSIEDIKNISGIGESKFDLIKNSITIK